MDIRNVFYRTVLISIFFLSLAFCLCAEGIQTWQGANGKSVRGELLDFDGRIVRLRMENGDIKRVAISLFAESEQKRIRAFGKLDNPFESDQHDKKAQKSTKQKNESPTTSNKPSTSNEFVVKMGGRETILKSGHGGLNYFPDLQLGFIATRPHVRLLMIAGNKTYLMEGKDLWSLQPVKPVLEPGTRGSLDNGYSGASSVMRDPKQQKRLVAFIHAEDQEGMPVIAYNGVAGFYSTICVAESFDNGYTFRKIGPIITSRKRKDIRGAEVQGCADPCVILDKNKSYYLAYYSDHNERFNANRGYQISVARCSAKDGGLPGKWHKYFDGEFKEPGLGGKDTVIVRTEKGDASCPSIAYIRSIDKYVMVHCVLKYAEGESDGWRGAKKSGLYLAISDDGIHWSDSKQINVGYPVPLVGKEFMGRPTLVPIEITKNGFQGYVIYTYSPSWGHKPPHSPHYMAGQKITFTLE